MSKAYAFVPDGRERLDFDAMLKFLEKFDPVDERYGCQWAEEDCEKCDKVVDTKSGSTCAGEMKCRRNSIGYQARIKLLKRTNVPFQSPCQPETTDRLKNNLRHVYGRDDENLKYYPEIHNLVHEKILRQYIGIHGLSRLFTEQYWNIELPMLLEIDSKKGEQRYYRDHFLHQVKNAYELYTMLRKMNLMHHAKSVLGRKDGAVSIYVQNCLRQSLEYALDHASVQELYEAAFKSDPRADVAKEQYMENNLLEYIIMASALTAALFHDIGYPIAYAMRQAENMQAYSSNMNYFLDYRNGFDRILSLLENSFLFRIVNKDLIKKKFDTKDHGTLSALMFLLYYYETNIIDSLQPERRAVVELAALAIFDHTLDYEALKIEKKDNVDGLSYRPTFYRNPISFLLRFCDDIQEWDRFSFALEPENREAVHICARCKFPVIVSSQPRVTEDKKVFPGQRCLCEDTSTLTLNKVFQKPTQEQSDLLKRLSRPNGQLLRIMNSGHREMERVRLCDSLLFRDMDLCHTTQHGSLALEIELNAYDLLYLCTYNPKSVHFTAKELLRIRKYLEHQAEFPDFYVRSDVTNNPIDLKIQLIEQYLMQKWKKTREDIFKEIRLERADELFHDALNELRSIARKIYTSTASRDVLTARMEEYARLCVFCWMLENGWDDVWELYWQIVQYTQIHVGENSAERKLIRNCLSVRFRRWQEQQGQSKRIIKNDKDEDVDMYHLRFFETDGISDEASMLYWVRQYTNPDNYDPHRAEQNMDMYSDLYFFYVLRELSKSLPMP